MAKIKIVACDTAHSDGLRPAVGRFGIQHTDAPVRWRDACQECLDDAEAHVSSAAYPQAKAGAVNGTQHKKAALHARGITVRTRLTPTQRQDLAMRVAKLLRKAGPLKSNELLATLGIRSKYVLKRALEDIGAKATGNKFSTMYALGKSLPIKPRRAAKSAKRKAMPATKGKANGGKANGKPKGGAFRANTPAAGVDATASHHGV